MIDLTKPVFCYDDRSKCVDTVHLQNLLYVYDDFCLCTMKWSDESVVDEPILFKITSGEVLNAEFMYWFATNELK